MTSTGETRVAAIAIVVQNNEAAEQLNAVLHDYANIVIGRMGIPYRERGMNIIMVAVDAPHDVISALSGKLGAIEGVTAKTAYSA